MSTTAGFQRFRILNMSVIRLRNAINQPYDHWELLLVIARKLKMKVKRFPGKVTFLLFPYKEYACDRITLSGDFSAYGLYPIVLAVQFWKEYYDENLEPFLLSAFQTTDTFFTMISSRLLLIILITSEVIRANPVTKEKKVTRFLFSYQFPFNVWTRLAKKPEMEELEEEEMEAAVRRNVTRGWKNSSSPLTAWELLSASEKWSETWGKLIRRRLDLCDNLRI